MSESYAQWLLGEAARLAKARLAEYVAENDRAGVEHERRRIESLDYRMLMAQAREIDKRAAALLVAEIERPDRRAG